MKITFLEAALPLVKTFSLKNGKIEKSNYPMVKNFTSHTKTVNNLLEFKDALETHAALGHCMLKGNVIKPLKNEPRKGSTNPNGSTYLIILDVDGIPGIKSPEEFIALLPKSFRNVSYIVQFSASMGITGDGLRCHIYFILDVEEEVNVLKLWLQRYNLDQPVLRNAIRLTRTKNACTWPLDITVCQPDKLIFIAPPQLGRGVESDFKGAHIQYVKKRSQTLKHDFKKDIKPETLKFDTITRINEIRKLEGLSTKRTIDEKVYKKVAVGAVTNQAEVTGIKHSEDFTYLNLNGGDSWGYFHPTDNPEIIFNFKGESNYITKDLLPVYYTEAIANADELKQEAVEPVAELESGETVFAFIDRKTDQYYRGTFDPETNTLDMAATNKMLHVQFFYRGMELEPPTVLDLWDLDFRFDEDFVFDPDAKRINLYRPTQLMQTPASASTGIPPIIKKVIYHACGSDDDSYNGMINWIAYNIQYRCKSGQAWVLHGTQGTGKGLLFNNIIAPIFGEEYCPRLDLEQLATDKFNGHLENAVFGLVDEAHMEEITKVKRLNSKMKELITEPTLSIRPMGAKAYKARSYLNVIIASNDNEPIHIHSSDRRFSVAMRQDTPLRISLEEIKHIDDELETFVAYLKAYEVDVKAAITPLLNAARSDLQALSRDSNEEVAQHILEGDFQYLFDYRPIIENPEPIGGIMLGSYDAMLREIFEGNHKHGKLTTDHLYCIFHYLTGMRIESKVKFGKFLRHRGIRYDQMRYRGEKALGIQNIRWQISEELEKEYTEYLEGKTKGKPIRRVK